ncbi:MAG: hypothetical protein K5770_09050 [Lachnospiraceae bacterium]|nr:hypothetical protein [Lachnospiraceae bacterium]
MPVKAEDSSIEDNFDKKAQAPETGEDDKIYGSLTELFEAFMNGQEAVPPALEALSLYESEIGLNTVDQLKEEFGGVGTARFAFGYIDGDDIPELLMSFGTFHVAGVYIFTINKEIGETVLTGEFSSFGGVSYVEKKNRILSQYGNHGYYMQVVSMIDGGRARLVGSGVDNGGGRDGRQYYYAGYELPEGVDGTRKDSYFGLGGNGGEDCIEIDGPDDSFIVSEEEYMDHMEELLNLGEEWQKIKTGDEGRDHIEEQLDFGKDGQMVEIGYNSMSPVNLKPGGLNLTGHMAESF